MLQNDNYKNLDAFDFENEIYHSDDLFACDMNKQREIQFKAIKQNFTHHYYTNQLYREFCDLKKVTPECISSYEDLYDIPQIPTAAFKKFEIISGERDDFVKMCTSSGTQGYISKIYRSKQTFDRLMNSIMHSLKEFYNLSPENTTMVILGPNMEESGELWFSYIISTLSLHYESHFFVSKSKLLKAELNAFLKAHDKYKRMLLVSAPIMYKYFIEYLEEEGIDLELPQDTVLVTAGGWKKNDKVKLEREEFEARIHKNLSIPKENIFDVYNQVELNTVMFECQHKHKHIPPWLKVIIRDPITLAPADDSDFGIISYLDSSSLSFPCFVLTDDFGRVRKDCECGRKGYYMEHVRRVNKVETKGCAIKLGNMNEKD